MSKQAVVADRDTLSKNVDTDDHRREPNPRKKIGDECHESKQVDDQNSPQVKPVDGEWLNGFGDGY